MMELHATVFGKVQGVFFRAWTRDLGRSLGLSGWVRNRADGSVETLAQGEEQALKRFRAALAQGPPLARVVRVDIDLQECAETLSGFEIHR